MPLEGFKFVSGKPKEFKRSDLENAVTRLFVINVEPQLGQEVQ